MSDNGGMTLCERPSPRGLAFVLFGKAMDAVSSLLCYPCTAVSALSKHSWHDLRLCSRHKGENSSSDNSDQQALPTLRRAETSLLTQLEDSSVPDDIQLQSSLLSKIPYEIRQQIYEEILGGHLFHIFRLRERLAHVICKVPHKHRGYTSKRPYGCWGTMDTDMLYVHYSVRSRVRGSLALLKTCRRVYVGHPS